MANVTPKTMKTILELRLKNLQQKLASAQTENEKLIYKEAIDHCIHDSKRVMLSLKRRRATKIVIWACLIIIAILAWKLELISRSETNTLIDENQSIGKAVNDSGN